MISLAVKYRPQDFSDVTEQASVKTILTQQLETGEFKHAYLFCGGAGTGKTTCARIFAAELNKGQGNPIELDAASNNGVDDVREIIKQAKMKPLAGEYKCFILDECHSISNAGWQAFLKIIEEPPKTSIFIFCTTNPEKIPKTILSRVQRYDFQKISNEGIVKRLHDICVMEEITLNNRYENALEYISKMAEGGMRDAITMLDKVLAFSPDITVENALKVLGTVDYDVMIELTECLLNYRTKSQRCIEIIESIHWEGKDLKQFVSKYIQFLIDLNKYCIGCDWKYISLPNSEAYVSKLDNLIKCQHDDIYIIDLVEKFIEIDTAIKYSATPRYDIEARLLLM